MALHVHAAGSTLKHLYIIIFSGASPSPIGGVVAALDRASRDFSRERSVAPPSPRRGHTETASRRWRRGRTPWTPWRR